LQKDEAHIYILDIENVDFQKYQFLITHEEEKKAGNFRQKEDTQRFLAGRIFIKKLLAGYIGIAPELIFIKPGINKKPVATTAENKQLPQFNISHSGNKVLIAISNSDVGVDIEMVEDIDFSSFQSGLFSLQEQQLLSSAKDPTRIFFKLWTRKESFLKAIGLGLIDNLDSLEVTDGIHEFTCLPLKERDFEIITFQLKAGYIASICIEKGVKAVLSYLHGFPF